MTDREKMFQEMVREFPDSPMGHFSLGKFYLEQGKFTESAQSLAEAVRLDPDYAAAWVALGDAQAAAGQTQQAKDTYQRAKLTPHGQKDGNLVEDIDQRLADL